MSAGFLKIGSLVFTEPLELKMPLLSSMALYTITDDITSVDPCRRELWSISLLEKGFTEAKITYADAAQRQAVQKLPQKLLARSDWSRPSLIFRMEGPCQICINSAKKRDEFWWYCMYGEGPDNVRQEEWCSSYQ